MYIQLIRLTCLFSASSTLRVTSIFPSLCQKVSKGDVCRQLTWFQSTSSHPWRPNRGDSPRWTCERVTGKQEHTDVCYTTYPCVCVCVRVWVMSFCYFYLINSVLINWDGLEPAYQSLGFRIWVCLWNQWVICNGQRSKPFRQAGALHRGC